MAEAAQPDPRRRTVGPVVLLGLASGALAAYAGSKPWVHGTGTDSAPGEASVAWGEVTSSPLGTALALVVLACWGVVLVTRGRFRRVVTGLSLLSALGYAVTVGYGPFTLPGHLEAQVRRQTGADLDDTSLTAWFWVAVVAAALVLATTALALRLVRHWPEMGTKYDAPAGVRTADGAGTTTTPAATPATTPTENIDIWKALDEGRDPTA